MCILCITIGMTPLGVASPQRLHTKSWRTRTAFALCPVIGNGHSFLLLGSPVNPVIPISPVKPNQSQSGSFRPPMKPSQAQSGA